MHTEPTHPGESMLADAEVERRNQSILRRLISVCTDGELGFRAAAEDVRTPACKTLLVAFARERRKLKVELEEALRRKGGAGTTSGTLAGRVHREWMDWRARLFGRDAPTVLAECERGEERALRAYDEALRLVFDPGLRATIARQRDRVSDARDSLRSLIVDR